MQMHQESRVDALIFLNDMTFFPRDGQLIPAPGEMSVGKAAAEVFLLMRWTMSCKECAYGGAEQPGCSSQALRRSRRVGGGRRSPADGRPGRGAGPRARLERGVHRC